MANTIQLRRSSVAGKIPTTAQVELGELAINTHDGKVFIKKDDGTAQVIEVGAQSSVEVRNDSGSTINKGAPVYISGTHASGKPTVALADNDGTSTVPAIGLVMDDIADEAEGFVVLTGLITGLATDTYSSGDPLYLSATAGSLTTTRPTATSQKVQKVGFVTRSHASAGSILVIGAGRTNDIPNELVDLTGVALNATDLGTFTGVTIADNRDIKEALQDLETQVENNKDFIPHATFLLNYKYSTAVTNTPSSGHIQVDNSNWSLATELYIHDTDQESRELNNFYTDLLKKGHRVFIQQDDDSDRAFVGTLTADATLSGDVYTCSLSDIEVLSGGTAVNNKSVTMCLLPPGAANLVYDAATRVLSSSSGTSATLPVAVAAGDSGLMTGSDKTKVDGLTLSHISSLITLSGEPADETNLGTFTGDIISANTTIRNALQELATASSSNSAATPAGINAGFQYKYNTSTGASPSSGKVQTDNSDWGNATNIYVHKEDQDARDLSNIYSIVLKKGVRIYMQQNKQSSKAFFATLSGDATLSGNVFTLPITGVTTLTGGTAQNDKELTFAVVAPKHELTYSAGTRTLSGPGDVSATLTEVVASGDSGLMTGSDKAKLDGIASGAQVNVATDLGVTTTTSSNTITSSTGNNAIISEASETAAGLMSTAHHDKLDGISSGAEVNLTAAQTRSLLGIGSYTDDSAAGTGGLAAGDMYYNTTTSTYRLKS
jgi:hypothetical protein